MTDTRTPPSVPRARGIERLIHLFQVLHEQHKPMSPRQLVEATGSPRSSVYDLVHLLTEAGWLESDADGRVFFGRALHYFGLDYADHNSLIKRARPLMRRLSASFNETSQLCCLDGNKYTVLLNEHGTKPFSLRSEIGIKVPIPWTASGRVLLGHLQREHLPGLIPDEDFVLPGGVRIDPDAFWSEVEQARRQGHALTEGLVDTFACCMAAPITDETGQAVATICFTVGRGTPEERRLQLLAALKQAGHELSY